jgi:RNA polymerase sigma-70 factor, ECF subfamily
MNDGEGGAGEGYAEHRPLLFSIAYRMTGSVSDAEDICRRHSPGWPRPFAREPR